MFVRERRYRKAFVRLGLSLSQQPAPTYHDLSMRLPDDPTAACAILREFARQEPRAATVEITIGGLDHRREGVQVSAAQTLAKWRLHDAVPHLRRWLEELLRDKRCRWAAAGQAAKALAACINSSDAKWVLDAYFEQTVFARRMHLLPVVVSIEPNMLRSRLLQELRSDEPSTRLAALEVVFQSQLPQKGALIAPLQRDANESVAHRARQYLASIEAAG